MEELCGRTGSDRAAINRVDRRHGSAVPPWTIRVPGKMLKSDDEGQNSSGQESCNILTREIAA
jgi:hypothetical protein